MSYLLYCLLISDFFIQTQTYKFAQSPDMCETPVYSGLVELMQVDSFTLSWSCSHFTKHQYLSIRENQEILERLQTLKSNYVY